MVTRMNRPVFKHRPAGGCDPSGMSGFTLLEVLTVITIVAVLMVVALCIALFNQVPATARLVALTAQPGPPGPPEAEVLALLRRNKIGGIVLTLFDPRLTLTLQVAEQVRARYPEKTFQTVIPRNVRLSEAPSHGMPITQYDPTSRGAVAYQELTKELIAR